MPTTKMHGRINGSYEDINNIKFLKNFLIKEVENFKIKDKYKQNNDAIIFSKY